MPQHGPKKATFLDCTAAKKNPGVQEGKMGMHLNAGDAIADPCCFMQRIGWVWQVSCAAWAKFDPVCSGQYQCGTRHTKQAHRAVLLSRVPSRFLETLLPAQLSGAQNYVLKGRKDSRVPT